MDCVSRQYGDNVLVQFSGDALNILQSDIEGQYPMLNEEAIRQMEEVTKYGMSGKMDSDRKVMYDIQWGSPTGCPDDHVNTSELM